VLAATARDLEAETRSGRFREDLFYRINVVAVALPPLRKRRDDIAPLARHFTAQLARRFGRPLSLTDGAIGWLEGQEWPGNVRELENSIERAAVLTNEEILNASDFRREPLPTRHPPNSGEWGVGSGTLREAAERAEREAITAALRAANGNRREAAKALGVSLRTMFYKIDRYGIA
jgi:DNA-binding NtrC family response regulator